MFALCNALLVAMSNPGRSRSLVLGRLWFSRYAVRTG
jgi:hypothetical protein